MQSVFFFVICDGNYGKIQFVKKSEIGKPISQRENG